MTKKPEKQKQPSSYAIRKEIAIMLANIQMLEAIMSPLEKQAEDISIDYIVNVNKALEKLNEHLK